MFCLLTFNVLVNLLMVVVHPKQYDTRARKGTG